MKTEEFLSRIKKTNIVLKQNIDYCENGNSNNSLFIDCGKIIINKGEIVDENIYS